MTTVTGGTRLADKLRDMARLISNASSVKVGFLSEAKYPDGTQVAMVAAINEFGAPSRGQPPRPAFRNMIAAKSGEWPSAIAGLLKANNFDARKTLELTGQAIAGQLRESISTITIPPLKPATIKRKGFDKPWIDTGHLLGSVDYEVRTQ
jgi:hypothetical protein